MTKWHIVQGRFTDEEWHEIEKLMNKHNLKNSNQLVRKAVQELLGQRVSEITGEDYDSAYSRYRNVHNFYSYCKDWVFRDSPEIQKKLDDAFELFKKQFWSIWQHKQKGKWVVTNGRLDSFFHHQKRGRPKKEKRKRGRPKS